MEQKIEICANSLQSAIAAQSGGADRIELCSVLGVGGVTPSYGMIYTVKKNIKIEINVLIRPRQGDFLYSDGEVLEVMKDIEICSELGIDGVVVGALNPQAKIDMEVCKKWVEFAHRLGLSVTFHRAIDRAENIFEALEEVISLGCERVLTSGGCESAFDGRDTLKRMVEMAGDRIIVMPGAGINPSNIKELALYIGASEMHFSASSSKPSGMLRLGGIAEPEVLTVSSEEIVRAAVDVLRK